MRDRTFQKEEAASRYSPDEESLMEELETN